MSCFWNNLSLTLPPITRGCATGTGICRDCDSRGVNCDDLAVKFGNVRAEEGKNSRGMGSDGEVAGAMEAWVFYNTYGSIKRGSIA